MELNKIQVIIWMLRYNAIIFFIISFNTETWYEYNLDDYLNYGLWHACVKATCGKISKL